MRKIRNLIHTLLMMIAAAMLLLVISFGAVALYGVFAGMVGLAAIYAFTSLLAPKNKR